jgi:hypothetical protein
VEFRVIWFWIVKYGIHVPVVYYIIRKFSFAVSSRYLKPTCNFATVGSYCIVQLVLIWYPSHRNIVNVGHSEVPVPRRPCRVNLKCLRSYGKCRSMPRSIIDCYGVAVSYSCFSAVAAVCWWRVLAGMSTGINSLYEQRPFEFQCVIYNSCYAQELWLLKHGLLF